MWSVLICKSLFKHSGNCARVSTCTVQAAQAPTRKHAKRSRASVRQKENKNSNTAGLPEPNAKPQAEDGNAASEQALQDESHMPAAHPADGVDDAKVLRWVRLD